MLWDDVERIRSEAPIVHNITNYVVMNTTANALLATGASPVMAHALEEVEEMVALASALVLNIGTLSTSWVDAMMKAGLVARARGVPVVLDPVGAGATSLRTNVAHRLLESVRPTILRANGSEVRALAHAERGTRGVDSTHGAEEAVEAAHAISRRYGCVVSVSGAVDVIVDGDAVARVSNGVPLLARITGSGCAASALTGAFAAVNPSPFEAATNAMAFLGIAGELAAERAGGPGTFQALLFDAMSAITTDDLKLRAKVKGG